MTNFSRRSLIAAAAASLTAPAWAQVYATRRQDGLFAYDDPLAQLGDFSHVSSQPLLIEAIDVLRHSEESSFVRVRAGGAEGIVPANMRLTETISLFDTIFRPMLMQTDARLLHRTLDLAFRTKRPRGYKYSSLPYFICQGHVELAVMDLLGKIAGKRVCDLVGRPLMERIPIYASSLTRDTRAEQEVDDMETLLEKCGAKALKVKIGGRMSLNEDAYPGRSEALVVGLRKRLGDHVHLYVDANGSYDAPTAIEVGWMLEAHGVEMYEEPCDFEDFEMTRQVTDALNIPVAGGEQDTSLPKWRWMAEHRAVDILQPDIMYNGGFMRTLTVAKIAEKHGISLAPHYPKSGPETVPLAHFVSIIPNFKGFMEYRAGDEAPDFAYAPLVNPVDGHVDLPTGPGFGIEFDPDMLRRATKI